ncbi:ethanolamine utilization protein EutJ [Propionibacterium freudenreichii]|uniref:ethanolamine utilization protein EutJ n=1 Tax=Propionibacterium freudenreichii TaxID=1744 RepID=UPI000542CD70|nr:ethanolamine utilization protein EutJ [Propionibacterium freudenreichii]MDK9643626.1 ethanolamine utilization protein EutJ [Propionibacterium freudenreichii]CEG85493.1 Ethanolamine utilization protein EutJ [Propionibacterium freudenreichii]CEI24413.1 Ethanolamine utilization protein EutJ [Propionibacterium freudenreichii]
MAMTGMVVTTHVELPEQAIMRFAEQVRTGAIDEPTGQMRLGFDLGTANIVVAVVDAANHPIAGGWVHSTVVRDGVVVDWAGATSAVRALRADVEQRLGHEFTKASISIPPGISDGDIQVFANVIGAAGLDPDEVVDEPVAAARAMGITDGAVIDVGAGTTGVSILEDGKVVLSVDEATGGHHMTLVLAGSNNIDYDQAEAMKKDPQYREQVLGTIRPTLDKMATIAAQALGSRDVPAVYLVGGSSSFESAPAIFEARLHRPVVRPAQPLFITPLGIPMPAQEESR